nr:MAG TPA: hypothetical protein [Caudoviricetes sp.]
MDSPLRPTQQAPRAAPYRTVHPQNKPLRSAVIGQTFL